MRVKKRPITEGKQVGKLYHICVPRAALWNLKNNKIAPGDYSNTRRGRKTISFSRDKNFVVDTLRKTEPVFFQFVLDGDKISDNKKVIPYAAQYYQDYADLEKEEIIEGTLENLKKYLIKVVMFLDIDATLFWWACKNYSIEEDVIEILELLKNSGIATEIRPVNNKEDLTKARTTIPKDIASVIDLFKKVNSYGSKTMASILYNLCNKFFAGDKNGGSVKIQTKQYYHLIEVTFDEKNLPKVTDFKDEIMALVDTIKDELDPKDIVVTSKRVSGSSLGRHSDYKLSTVINNKTYLFQSIVINPYFDYLYNSYPFITIGLVNSKDKDLSFTVYFPIN